MHHGVSSKKIRISAAGALIEDFGYARTHELFHMMGSKELRKNNEVEWFEFSIDDDPTDGNYGGIGNLSEWSIMGRLVTYKHRRHRAHCHQRFNVSGQTTSWNAGEEIPKYACKYKYKCAIFTQPLDTHVCPCVFPVCYTSIHHYITEAAPPLL